MARLQPPGGSERDFAVNGVQDYNVEVNVPADAPAGDYIFHLDMLTTEDPDETYTVGPTVKLLVTEPKKPFPWWIILVALGILAVIVVIVILDAKSISHRE